jgi:hypothetical protein
MLAVASSQAIATQSVERARDIWLTKSSSPAPSSTDALPLKVSDPARLQRNPPVRPIASDSSSLRSSMLPLLPQ